jgi:MinD-like ATPase involved in chromosome partitioning or flagellar assembly
MRSRRLDRGRTSVAATAAALSFTRADGPLLALAGVCGGAGTTTLAYLLAAAAARASTAPVLLADAGGPAASVAAIARATSPLSLPALAELIERGERPTQRLFASGEHGLRILATAPRLDESVSENGVRAVLAQARSAHALTIVDAGTLTRPVERAVLAEGSHVAWVLPASRLGVRRAALLFGALRAAVAGQELVVARNDGTAPRSVISELAALADRRGAPLVLVPNVPDPLEHGSAAAMQAAATSLEAIGGVLRR